MAKNMFATRRRRWRGRRFIALAAAVAAAAVAAVADAAECGEGQVCAGVVVGANAADDDGAAAGARGGAPAPGADSRRSCGTGGDGR